MLNRHLLKRLEGPMRKKSRDRTSRVPHTVFLGLGFFLPLCFAVAVGIFSSAGWAQSVSGSDPLNQLRQQFGQQGGSAGTTDLTTNGNQGYQTTIIQSAPAPSAVPLPSSRLEQIMSARAGIKLEQFGYSQFGNGRAIAMAQTGAVQDDYILGPGDQIVVSLRGQENNEVRVEVNRNGQVMLPRLSPIPAIGRTFGSFRQDLEAAVHRAYVATTAFAAVSRVRQISVLVSGEVNVPGQRLLTGLSSVMDAILISGGIKKTGSLRNIRIQRGNREIVIDLYNILTAGGVISAANLADGDRIIVGPLGRTVAVAGLVRQPGIFELPIGLSGISVRNLLVLAGGEEVRGRYRLSLLHIDSQGRTSLEALVSESGQVRDSEILSVQLGADQTSSQATLSGGTGLAGQYPIASGTKLSSVIKAPGALGPAPYTLFGIIARKDSRSLLRYLVAFTPIITMNGGEDQTLQNDDIIRVLSVNEVRLLANTVRLYKQRQATVQEAIRNPLAASDNLPSTPVGPVVPAKPGAPPIMPESPVNPLGSQLNMADQQRNDIAALATRVDPVTEQGAAVNALAQQQQQVQQQSLIQQQNLQSAIEAQQAQAIDPMATTQPSSTPSTLPAATSTTPGGSGSQPFLLSSQQPTPALNFETSETNGRLSASNREIANFGDLARQLGVDQLVLVNFLIDHQAVLNGAVNGPGAYFVGPNVPLLDLVQAAGGTANWADESGVELISTAVDTRSGGSATQRTLLPLRRGTLANYVVRPRDEFRFNQIFTDVGFGNATVQGEVRFNGTYQIIRGEHLSDLIMRAGGLTNTAYPAGTIFLRKSAALTEHEGYIRAAAEIENQLVVAMTHIGNDKIDPGSFASLQTFINELRNQKAIGRIAITADPSVLASNPALDPLLEPGDVLYIPQRPTTISVLGQVMQPGSFPYRPGLILSDYLDQAGGYAATSDESLTFIVLPDGSARRIQKSWLSFDAENLPPGSTIVVPRDVTPLDTRQMILDVSAIFSQFAVSLASLAVLAKN